MKLAPSSIALGFLAGFLCSYAVAAFTWQRLASGSGDAIAEAAASQTVGLVRNFIDADGAFLTRERMERRLAGLYATQVIIASQQLPKMSDRSRERLREAVESAKKVPALAGVRSGRTERAERLILEESRDR